GRWEGWGMRKEGGSGELAKRFIRDVQAVRPDQPIILPDAPAIGYVSADHFLAVGGTTKHKPLEGKQLRSGRKVDVRLAADPCAIEDDCLLREPRELGGLAHFQPCRDSRGLIQSAIDLFGRLR